MDRMKMRKRNGQIKKVNDWLLGKDSTAEKSERVENR